MLFNLNLLSEFWREAAQTVCYLRNRLFLENSHRTKTLYELWTEFKLFIEHLRVFEYIVYIYISSIKWVKLKSISHCEIFVEYCSTSKQFKVYFSILKMTERVSHLINFKFREIILERILKILISLSHWALKTTETDLLTQIKCLI